MPILLLGLASFGPALFTLAAILAYGVNLPISDEWLIADLLDEHAQGTLSLADLFAQQNEYRQFFPNLIFVWIGSATAWDVRVMMAISFLLALVTLFSIYRLSLRTMEEKFSIALLGLSSSLIIFSPRQFENWLEGQQLIYFIPSACLTACLLLAQSPSKRPELRLLLCAALCLVSTFSSANGIVCWLVMAPALLRAPAWAAMPRRGLWALAWLGAFVASAVLYLDGYERPAASPPPEYALTHIGEAAAYFLSLLGSPLGFGGFAPIAVAIAVGAVFLGLYPLALLRYFRSDAEERQRALPWLLLAAYSILTAGVITVARVGFGLEQSGASRYSTFTLFLPLACAYLLALQAGGGRVRRPASARVPLAFVSALIALHVPIYLLGLHQMSVLRSYQMGNKACVLVSAVIADDCAAEVYPDPGELRRLVQIRDRLGFMNPRLLTSDRAGDLAARTSGRAAGSFGLTPGGGGDYIATGTARLPDGEPAHAVLLAHAGRDGEPRFFALARVAPDRHPFWRLLRGEAASAGQWRETLHARHLTQRPLTLSAWAFDARTGRAYPLAATPVAAMRAGAAAGSPRLAGTN